MALTRESYGKQHLPGKDTSQLSRNVSRNGVASALHAFDISSEFQQLTDVNLLRCTKTGMHIAHQMRSCTKMLPCAAGSPNVTSLILKSPG